MPERRFANEVAPDLGTPPKEALSPAAVISSLSAEVLAFMQHYAGDPHLGADLAQDAIAHALLSLDSLRDPKAIRGWLYRIAINRFNDHVRRVRFRSAQAPRITESTGVDFLTPEREALVRELDEVLRQALLLLPERQRSVLMLHGVSNLDQSEVAALLGISVPAVKMSLFHAREKMRERLGPYLDRVPTKRRPKNGGGSP